MDGYNSTAELRRLYASQSRNSGEKPSRDDSHSFIKLTRYGDGPPLEKDLNEIAAYTLGDLIGPERSIADRVFGQQLSKGKITGKHLGRLLSERWVIYCQHMEDLQQGISDMKNQLHHLSRPYALKTPQQVASLEKLLHQLESEQRKEQLSFWKDTGEVRDRILDTTLKYQGAKNRANLLGSRQEVFKDD